MNKILLYLLLLAGLGIAIYFVVFNQTTDTTEASDTEFAIKDTANISKIKITDRDGRKITLERDEEDAAVWKLNTYFTPRPDAIQSILNTIYKIKIFRPVSQSARKNVMKTLANPLKVVEIFTDDATTPEKKYIVGGTPPTKKGTHILLEGSDTPYVTYVPGYEGNMIVRFFTDLEEWRDRAIFRYQPEEIASIQIEYPFAPQNSFLLNKKNGNTFSVQALSEKATKATAPLNQEMAMEFIEQFKVLYAENFHNTSLKKDSILQTQPFCRMTVTNQKGVPNTAVVHFMPVNRRSKRQLDEQGKAIPYDPDRYFAFINKGRDLVIIQQYVFGPIFKKYSNFFAVEEPVLE